MGGSSGNVYVDIRKIAGDPTVSHHFLLIDNFKSRTIETYENSKGLGEGRVC